MRGDGSGADAQCVSDLLVALPLDNETEHLYFAGSRQRFQREVADGGMAEYMLFPANARVHRMPADMKLEDAVIILRRTFPADHPLVASTTRDLERARQLSAP